jgi:FkbM family methyltransferase
MNKGTEVPANPPPRVRPWRDSPAKRLMACLVVPLVYAMNRPAMASFSRAFYDLALRFNGIAINFKGRHGLTAGEERFVARHFGAGERGTLIDVGANGGAYAKFLRARCPAARIIAFEPHPVTFRYLAANTASDRIEAMNCAVGAAEGRLDLHDFADADGSTQASLSRDAVDLFTGNIVSHAVECTTIDAFMIEARIQKIEFLKIDTEGFDLDVLRGAARAISKRAIRMIQFEFIPANVARRIFMRDFFAALPGYGLHRLCLNGELLPLPEYSVKTCEIFVTQNLVALPHGSPC